MTLFPPFNIGALINIRMILNRVTKVSGYSVALMALTSIHHIYGALIYHTSWRLHVLLLSVPVMIVTVLLCRTAQRKGELGSPFFWIFLVITLVPSIGLIGAYEGIYNHILKNLLFYGGAGAGTLRALFPPPKYEMPNDAWFEITGVLQGIIVIPLTIQWTRSITSYFNLKPAK